MQLLEKHDVYLFDREATWRTHVSSQFPKFGSQRPLHPVSQYLAAAVPGKFCTNSRAEEGLLDHLGSVELLLREKLAKVCGFDLKPFRAGPRARSTCEFESPVSCRRRLQDVQIALGSSGGEDVGCLFVARRGGAGEG